MQFPLSNEGSKYLPIRHLLGAILVLVFLALIMSAYLQYRLAWNDLSTNLEASLSLEGRILASWLADALVPIGDLDPFEAEWETPETGPTPMRITGSSWILLDASGEVVTGPTGDPLYEYIGRSGKVRWEKDLGLIRAAIHSGTDEVFSTDLMQESGEYIKRVYLPVYESSGIISTPWVLAGQTGENVFSDLFKRQQRYWWTASLLSLALLLLLVILLRGIARTEKLERMLREAEASMELESLASTLAHELRNPLSIIQSSAEILLKEDLPNDSKELVSDLLEEVRRSQDVLNTHLHPYREETPMLEDVVGFIRAYWQHRSTFTKTAGLRIEASYPADALPIAVQADPGKLNQILDNLLRNSIEAMPEGGHIFLEVVDRDDSVLLKFRDSGPGPGRPVFFFRDGWKLGGGKPSGKGIGLRLVRKWVTRWGGTVELSSAQRKYFTRSTGMEVRITLRKVYP